MSEWNPNLPAVEIRKKARKKKAKPKPKKRGRKRIKRQFEETTLGYNLRLNAPMEYDMIINAGGTEPAADLIEAISYSSINPYFRGKMFRQLLIKYRQNGCFQRVPEKSPDAATLTKYMLLRRKRIRKQCKMCAE